MYYITKSNRYITSLQKLLMDYTIEPKHICNAILKLDIQQHKNNRLELFASRSPQISVEYIFIDFDNNFDDCL